VEAEARKNIENAVSSQLSRKITFIALIYDEASGKTFGEKLGGNSQTLLIVKANRRSILQMKDFYMPFLNQQKFVRL